MVGGTRSLFYFFFVTTVLGQFDSIMHDMWPGHQMSPVHDSCCRCCPQCYHRHSPLPALLAKFPLHLTIINHLIILSTKKLSTTYLQSFGNVKIGRWGRLAGWPSGDLAGGRPMIRSFHLSPFLFFFFFFLIDFLV